MSEPIFLIKVRRVEDASLISISFQVGIEPTDDVLLDERGQDRNWGTVGRVPIVKRMAVTWNRHYLVKRSTHALPLERALREENLVPRHRVFLTVNQVYPPNGRVCYKADRRPGSLLNGVARVCVVFRCPSQMR